MPKMSVPFTDRWIASLKGREGERVVYWEPARYGAGALGLRVSASTKTFVYMYWQDGKSKMMTLGRYPQISLAEAHKAVGEAMVLRERGGDPAEKQVAANEQRRNARSVAELADEYLTHWAKPRKRSWKEDSRILARDVVPVLGKRRLEDVRRREVVALLDGIVARGAPIAASRTLAVVRKMFNFAVKRGLLETSPCTLVDAPAKAARRERLLDADELRLFLEHLPDIPVWSPTGMALLFGLLTAQRSGEVVSAQWADLDLQERLWTIPAAKAKNGKSHLVPLSAAAVRLLQSAKQLDMGRGAVFPSRADGGHMVQTVMARALHRHHGKLAKAPFSPHDLRRTAATHMASIGVPRLVLSKVLNHTDTAVTSIYDRYAYTSEKRGALEKWAEHLSTLGLDEAVAKFEATVQWQVTGKWWDKRVERLGGASDEEG